jgi:hypothetical protein
VRNADVGMGKPVLTSLSLRLIIAMVNKHDCVSGCGVDGGVPSEDTRPEKLPFVSTGLRSWVWSCLI